MHERLRNDGDFVIYKVQAELEFQGFREEEPYKKWVGWKSMYGRWKDPVPDIPVRFKDKKSRDAGEKNEPFYSFTACGDCWQKTGIHGSFEKSKAEDLVKILLEHNPEVRFRIIEQSISQHTRVVATVKGK